MLKIKLVYSIAKFARTSINAIQASQLIQKHQNDSQFILLDVRTSPQYRAFRIRGSINMPNSQIQNKLSRLDKGKKYLVYCKAGFRSQEATELMREEGFKHVLNLEGGMRSWYASELPLESDLGFDCEKVQKGAQVA